MLVLEELYKSTAKHLSKQKQDWDSFSKDFSKIFDAKMALYQSKLDRDNLDFVEMDQLIATTDKKILEEFFDKEIAKYGYMFEDIGKPFEPFRRTDIMSDEEYRKQEASKEFLLPNNVFYLMITFAGLNDGSFLMLYLWRGEEQQDFTDLEKLRLTLFMRYLASLIRIDDCAVDKKDSGLIAFGKKYNLTEAETNILIDMLAGSSLKMIAKKRKRSYNTVRWHVQNILEKCQVKNQKDLLSEFYALIKN